MISRYLIVCISLTSFAYCQIHKEGYVGINFGGQLGGTSGPSGAGNKAKSYEKSAYVDSGAQGGSLAGNTAGAVSVEVPAPAVQSSIYYEKNIQPSVAEKEVPVQQNIYVRKGHNRRPAYRKHYAYVNANAEVPAPPPPRAGFLTKLFSLNTAPLPPAAPAGSSVVVHAQKDATVPVQHNVDTTYTATANVNKNGQLFTDIFNIPISTLQAVNRLVNNVVGGVSVNKQVNTYATKTVSANADANVNTNAYFQAGAHA